MARRSTRTVGLLAGVVTGAALLAPAPSLAQAGDTVLLGLRDGTTLVAFTPDDPGAATANPISGLASGDRLVGIDLRPADATVWGLGTSGTLYTIDPDLDGGAPAATAGPTLALNTDASAVTPQGGAFGFDFNPAADLLRVVSDTGQDLRIAVADRAADAAAAPGAVAGTTFVDGTLKYAEPGDPADTMMPPTAVTEADANAGTTPQAGAAGYTSNVAGTTSTQLYVIDAGLDVLALQNPPNAGILNTVGPLGVDADTVSGFDVSGAGVAYATFGATLHTIDIATGAATAAGAVGGGALDGLTTVQGTIGGGGGTGGGTTTAPPTTGRDALPRTGNSDAVTGAFGAWLVAVGGLAVVGGAELRRRRAATVTDTDR